MVSVSSKHQPEASTIESNYNYAEKAYRVHLRAVQNRGITPASLHPAGTEGMAMTGSRALLRETKERMFAE